MTFQCGVARADITPPVGIPMVGFAGRDAAAAVHDPLEATVLAASDGDDQLLIVSLDLLQLTAESVACIRQKISTATGVAPTSIALACSHTHYGPSVNDHDVDLVDSYRTHLSHVLAGVCREAMDRCQPARMGVDWGASDIGINRRELRDSRIVLGQNPSGPVDRSVGIARIDHANGQPIATVLNFACHPVSLGGRMAEISSGFPGKARRVVEEMTGTLSLYLQGACGDVNPIRMEHDHDAARSLGVRLGCEATRIWETIQVQDVHSVAFASKTIHLPGYRYDSQTNAENLQQELLRDIAVREKEGEQNSGPLWWARHRLERVEAAIVSWQTDEALSAVECEVSALRLGQLGLATAPGEIFAETGQSVKRTSAFEDTFFLGYTNGLIGYVPTRSAYTEGGYEVTHACRVDPGASEMIDAACCQVLDTLCE